MSTMTLRQRTERIYHRQPVDRIVFQPRFRYWYLGRNANGTMPDEFKDKSILDIHRALGTSPRYPGDLLGLWMFRNVYDDTVKVETFMQGCNRTVLWKTPRGDLQEVYTRSGSDVGECWSEHPIKTPEDMETMIYILDHSKFVFDTDQFEQADRAFGDLGPVQAYFSRSPLQRLIVEYMGLEKTTFALFDTPDKTHELMKAIERVEDRMYEVLCEAPIQYINFGENIDARLDSPIWYEKYMIPYYKKRITQLHAAGKICYIHMDGALKPLLPYMQEPGFDGIEAATPIPQGDVTVEELKEAMGDTILIDGIPALLFLPDFPEEDLFECTEKLIEQFAPNLILGVSDELPTPADIERVRKIAQLVENTEIKR